MSVKYILILFAMLVSSGCCPQNAKLMERPANLRGWKPYQLGTVNIEGAFVLTKGEHTDNGKVGIRVLDIYPAECKLFSEPVPAKAKLEFYQVSSSDTLCTATLGEGSIGLDNPNVCGTKVEWTTMYVNGINIRDSWVSFDLRK